MQAYRLPRARVGTAGLAFTGLLAFMAIVYANPGNWFEGMQEFPLAKVAAALALGALAGSWLLYNRPVKIGGATGWCLIGLFTLVGLSSTWSLWPETTVNIAVDGLKYLAIFFVVVNVVDSEARLATFVRVFAWATLIPAFGSLWSWMHGEHLVEGDRVAWIGVFANPNDLAYHLVVGIAMVLCAREAARSPLSRLIYLAMLVPIAFSLLLTQSRGGLLAAGAVLLFWAIRSLKRAPTLIGIALAIGVVLYLGPGNVWSQRMQEAQSHGVDLSAQGRVDAWRTGMAIAAERPWTGVGAGAFVVAWPSFAPGDVLSTPRTEHNTFVQLLAELGLPALTLFVVAFFLGIFRVSKAAREPTLTSYARGIQAALAGFAICSATSGIAFTWPIYLLLGASVATRNLSPGAKAAIVPAANAVAETALAPALAGPA